MCAVISGTGIRAQLMLLLRLEQALFNQYLTLHPVGGDDEHALAFSRFLRRTDGEVVGEGRAGRRLGKPNIAHYSKSVTGLPLGSYVCLEEQYALQR